MHQKEYGQFFSISPMYVTKCAMSTIAANDNGAYVKIWNTTKLYCQMGDETKGVCDENRKFYYSVKQSYNSYKRNMFCLIKPSCYNEVNVRPNASP